MDGFERAHAEDVLVVRLDIRSQVGNYLAYRFGVRAVPTFIMFGADGNSTGSHVGIATSGTLEMLLDAVNKER